jgi:chromosome segregation ATPase
MDELEKARDEIARLQALVPTGKAKQAAAMTTQAAAAPSAEMKELKAKVAELTAAKEAAQKQVAEERARASKAEQDLLKKVQQTTPFLNMRKMIKQKNDSVRTLRELLRKHAPTVPLPGEDKEPDDADADD